MASPASVEAYLASLPTDVQATLEVVRRTIRGVLPDGEEVISYGMPAFRLAAGTSSMSPPGSTTSASTLSRMSTRHGTDPATIYLPGRPRMREPSLAATDGALHEDRELFRLLAMRRTVFAVPAGWGEERVDVWTLLNGSLQSGAPSLDRNRFPA